MAWGSIPPYSATFKLKGSMKKLILIVILLMSMLHAVLAPVTKPTVSLTVYNGGMVKYNVLFCTNLVTGVWDVIDKGRFKTRGEYIISVDANTTMISSKTGFFIIEADTLDKEPQEDTYITKINIQF